ncbi:MAG: hypothetical protein LBT55_05875 [Clostridiaceae bacterium]|jgi:hypothetical protein|nr:hypothetical protein [Clostridiaceae bacterium]
MNKNNSLSGDNTALSEFNAVCNDLRASKLILASKEIRRLLKCIAYYDKLRETVDASKIGFDYPKAYMRAATGLGSRTAFKLPKGSKARVALVVCLFAEFDMNRRNLMKFILDFFPAENGNRSYEQFAENLVRPFQEAFNLVYKGEDVPAEEQGAEEAAALAEGLADQARYVLTALVEAVKEASIETEERDECSAILEGFELALDTRDPFLLKVIWIGLKHTLSGIRSAAKKLRELEEILIIYKAI